MPFSRDDLRKLGYAPTADGSWARPAAAKPQPQAIDMNQAVTSAPQWRPEEIEVLRRYYSQTPYELFSLEQLAQRLGRSFAAVALKASRLGLTDKRTDPKFFSGTHRQSMSEAQKRRCQEVGSMKVVAPLLEHSLSHPNPFLGKSHSQESRAKMSESQKRHIEQHGHSRGMKGKTHTEEVRRAISRRHKGRRIPREQVMRMLKTKAANGTLVPPRHKTTWKSGWVTVGGNRFFARSSWEVNYARYLEWMRANKQIAAWEHEPKTFWFEKIKRGCVSYLPDFRVVRFDGSEEYHEVKGYMDARSKTKIKRMGIYYPQVKLIVIDSRRYKALMESLRGILP